jgi:hypothetical protein
MPCVCAGLGVYVGGNGSAYELMTCDHHPLPANPKESIESDDIAVMRADECLHALAGVRDILWPEGRCDASWSPDTVDAIARCLAFLAPQEPLPRESPQAPDFFSRPVVNIQGVRPVDGEAALLGHVFVHGVMHHAWFVQVEEADGDQVAVNDPYNRLEEFQQLDADAGRFQTVEVPGFSGQYVLVIYPAGD